MVKESEFGLGVPVCTAVDAEGNVDFKATERYWRYIFPKVNKPVILDEFGQGGRIINRSVDDAKRLLDLAVDVCEYPGDRLIVGTGSELLSATKALTSYASSKTIRSVLVRNPIHSQSELVKFRFDQDPLSEEYQRQLVKYHKLLLKAMSKDTEASYMMNICPELTAGDSRGYMPASDLRQLKEYADSRDI